jgi:prepilin-type N-terminal cleavage/methylation domain-containing protein
MMFGMVDMKLLKSKKGMTLLETILALAVLGIISAPLLTVFTNAAVIVKKTNDRLEINAVTRIIKENVTNSVKYGGNGHGICISGTATIIDLQVENGSDLEVKGINDEVNLKYKFDAERTVDFGYLSYSDNDATILADTCEYTITLKKANGVVVQKLKILINKLDGP